MARLYRPGREGGIFKGRPPRFVGWRVLSTGMTIAADGSIDLLPSLLAGEGLRISRPDDYPLVYSPEAVIGRAIEAIAVYLTHLARE